MLYPCPVCRTHSVGFFRKWLSNPVLPAHCAHCGSYSSAHQAAGGTGLVLAALCLTACGFTASAFNAAWPWLLGLPLALLVYLWKWHRVQLEPLTPDLIAQARKTETMGALALLLAAMFQ